MSDTFIDGGKVKDLLKQTLFEPKVPNHLFSGFLKLSPSRIDEMRASLTKNFFSQEDDGYLETDAGRADMEDHLSKRLHYDRNYVITWIADAMELRGANILEIGCGTGTSTIALAEQGAHVTAVDIDELALIDAEKRCALYDLQATFHNINSTQLRETFGDQKFDLIIFWACLEHMTHEERRIAMSDSWKMLSPGGLWALTDTPNRLHFFDSHTSLMPFYNWLPDDLAIEYSKQSPRQNFADSFTGGETDNEAEVKLARWGRGMSFHEFDLAMKPADQLDIVSSLSGYHRGRRFAPMLKSKLSRTHVFEKLLHNLHPKIDRGFFRPYLDLIIRK